jgi:hypothetical protein
MTTGPDKGPVDWYEVNGQVVIVHLFANQRGYEVYAPVSGASLSVQETFDALDRIAASNPAPLSVDRQLTGAVGDLVRMAAAGNTEADDLQRLACALLGKTTPNMAGAARGVIAEMEHGPAAKPEAQALLSAARSTQDLYWSALRNLEAFLEIEIDGTKDLRETDIDGLLDAFDAHTTQPDEDKAAETLAR